LPHVGARDTFHANRRNAMTSMFSQQGTLKLIAAWVVGLMLTCATVSAAPTERAYVAGGCFWCVEADFEKVRGVSEVISGFSGGDVPNPTYKQVVRGGTGHYEAVEIRYDPDVVSYAQLLDLFFRSVDPLDAGGQFCDRGNSYRTAIFVQNASERQAAEASKARHQDYYKKGDLILTRFGPRSKREAYKLYRDGCQRDQRIRELWGSDAPFAG
jgi:peptide-methionine (S)-S-oxide reductase